MVEECSLACWFIFKAFSNNIGTGLLPVETKDNFLYALCSESIVASDSGASKVLTLFLINKVKGQTTLAIKLPSSYTKVLSSQDINAGHYNLRSTTGTVPFLNSKGMWHVELSPLSLTIIKYQ